MKREQDLPPQPWLSSQLPPPIDLSSSSSSRLEYNHSMMITHHPQNPNPREVLPPSFQIQPHTTVLSSSSPHMSATALLQKAAQISVMSSEPSTSMMTMIGPHQFDDHMIAKKTTAGNGLLISSTSLAASTAGSGAAAGLSSPQGLSFGNKPRVNITSGCMEQMGATTTLQGTVHDMMMITTSSMPSDHASCTGFGGSSSLSAFEEAFNGMFKPKMGNVEGGGGNEGLSTRDFFGS